MKKKLYFLCLYTLFALYIYYLFTNKLIIEEKIISSFNLFITKVFPSLFPMFIISEILISLNLPYYLNKYLTPLFKKIFNIDGPSIYILIMSLLSGTPTNAVITSSLLNKHFLSSESATTILSYTLLSNPLFLYTMLSLTFPSKICLILIINNYLANLILGIILRNHNTPSTYPITYQNIPLSTSIISAIQKSLTTLLMILGTIIFFNLIPTITSIPIINTLFTCFLEITNGLSLLSTISISLKLKIIIASLTISFTGLCIHTQIKSIISDTSINYTQFLKNRFSHLIISLILNLFTIMIA